MSDACKYLVACDLQLLVWLVDDVVRRLVLSTRVLVMAIVDKGFSDGNCQVPFQVTVGQQLDVCTKERHCLSLCLPPPTPRGLRHQQVDCLRQVSNMTPSLDQHNLDFDQS